MRTLGIYVHFPFCRGHCPYCDFHEKTVDPSFCDRDYSRAVLREMNIRASVFNFMETEVKTIYVGGGTPSLWSPSETAALLEGIRSSFRVDPKAEITIEANPCEHESHDLSGYRRAGFNRISLGIQSFQQKFLDAIGRRHLQSDSLSAVERAKEAGFEDISLDLIYGLPGQTAEDAKADVAEMISAGPSHISAYCLSLHPGTPMEIQMRSGNLSLPDEDTGYEIGEEVCTGLENGGYKRYEISNFARNRMISRHNYGYWTGREYLGLGAGSHGFILNADNAFEGGFRYSNISDPDLYIESVMESGLYEEERENLDAETLLRERLFLGLRLIDGVNISELSQFSGIEVMNLHGETISKLEAENLVIQRDGFLKPTRKGLLFNDFLGAEF